MVLQMYLWNMASMHTSVRYLQGGSLSMMLGLVLMLRYSGKKKESENNYNITPLPTTLSPSYTTHICHDAIARCEFENEISTIESHFFIEIS